MPLPDYIKVELGTAIVWGEAGAAGVTHTLSLDALADGLPVWSSCRFRCTMGRRTACYDNW